MKYYFRLIKKRKRKREYLYTYFKGSSKRTAREHVEIGIGIKAEPELARYVELG